MHRTRLVPALTLTMALTAVLAAPAQARSGPSCPTGWGSLPKSSTVGAPSGPDQDLLVGLRTGRHACYDRVVLRVAHARGATAYDVRYVPAVHAEGSGDVVPLRGNADLQVVLTAPSYDDSGRTTFPASRRELADVRGYPSLRQVAGAGSFEGQTTLGVGVRARLPFRVFTLAGGGAGGSAGDVRVVVDVARSW